MRCGCGTTSTGPTVINNSACVSSSGAGTAADPFRLAPIVDPDTRNLFTCGAAGMKVTNPESPGLWTAYTPTWTSTGTQPVIGNGLLGGLYRKSGHSLEVSVLLVFGTSTTGGTGVWRWALPAGLVSGFTAPLPIWVYNAETGADYSVAMGTAVAPASEAVIRGAMVGQASGPGGSPLSGGDFGDTFGSTVEISGTVYVTT